MFHVMIADDEPIARKALQVLTNWESIDCQVVYVASDGQEVIDNIANVNPDIIITDIKMPGVDGLSITKYVKENKLPTKVILLTAYADFSYAKTALQYGAVDYVIKVGAFDGLLEAIERAKQLILKERESAVNDNQAAAKEIFFKSLIDGSIYDGEEIHTKAVQYGIHLKDYMVLLFRFRVDDNLNRERKEKIHNSLLNFFGMVFQKRKMYIISPKRNLFCVLLDAVQEKDSKDMKSCCEQVSDIVMNFMKLDVHIGGSRITENLQDLRKAYSEAELAIGGTFYRPNTHICFYEPSIEKHGQGLRESQQYIDEICRHIQNGEKEKAIHSFEQLFHIQSENQVPVETIKSNGIFIECCCRQYLAEFDVSVAEIINSDNDTVQMIYDCFQMEEFRTAMLEIISKTADFINQSIHRRSSLIYECEKLIRENVESCISVSKIAARLGVSGSYLSRVFKDKTGSTVINAINRAKLETAQNLLRNTDMKIYEIADRLGFENITYFSHFFKKHTQLSPIEFKKKCENNGKEE